MAKTRARARTNTRRAHRVWTVVSVLLLLAGVVIGGIGAYAWSMPGLPPTAVPPATAVPLGNSPWFDQGSTLFAEPASAKASTPATFRCTITLPEGGSRTLDGAPNLNKTGTRVVEETALEPVVTVGPSTQGQSVECDPVVKGSQRLWLLPTDPGVPRVPLSLVIAGIALLGFAALAHPRGRGIVPFGS